MQNHALFHQLINQRHHRPAHAWRQQVKPRTNQLEGTHILIVDDDEPVRTLLQVALQQVGYCVYTAANGQEAFAVFEQRSIDLVFLDLILPVMDGYTLCAELRKRSDVPIVILSTLGRPDDIVYGLSLGADDYIAKPFRVQEIEVRIQLVLRSYIRRKEQFDRHDHSDCVIAHERETYKVQG
jgi:DNA-binding response OmpR family regulator